MKRPHLVTLSILKNQIYYSIRLLATLKNIHGQMGKTPIQNLTNSIVYDKRINLHILIIAFHACRPDKIIFKQSYWTNELGVLELKIPNYKITFDQTLVFQFFELSYRPKISLYLGNFLPKVLPENLKIVISDFDKTLVDTKYSTAQQVFASLSSTVNMFPTLIKGLEIFKSKMATEFIPFIVSASPHFYENPIRDWLYQQDISTSEIFLKDYKSILGPFHGYLSLKDIGTHGFYKLITILKILNQASIPRELVLIGDNFESDPLIYLTVGTLLNLYTDPWALWKKIANFHHFEQTTAQQSNLLDIFFRTYEATQKLDFTPKVFIYIRIHTKGVDLKKFEIPIPENVTLEYYSES